MSSTHPPDREPEPAANEPDPFAFEPSKPASAAQQAEPVAAPPPNPVASAVGLVGAVVGVAFGRYCGLFLFIPFVCAAVAGGLMSLVVPARNKPMLFPAAVQTGHGMWMVIGIFLAAQFAPALVDPTLFIDITILFAGSAWLLSRPSIVCVVLLCVYQLIGLGVNASLLAEVRGDSDIQKALIAHVLLRLAGLGTMIYGLIEWRKAQRPASPAEAQPAEGAW
jgi:hypothetical protein